MPRIAIVCCDFGNGKTEVSFSLAQKKSREVDKVVIIYRGTIHPFSGSRDVSPAYGIAFSKASHLPSLSQEIRGAFSNEVQHIFIIICGSREGAKGLFIHPLSFFTVALLGSSPLLKELAEEEDPLFKEEILPFSLYLQPSWYGGGVK